MCPKSTLRAVTDFDDQYEYNEDAMFSLFSIKGPRDTTPLLDIERALNQLEKVALKMRKARGRPLLLMINNIHLFRDDEAGRNLLEILQQRAGEIVPLGMTNHHYPLITNRNLGWQ